MGKISDYTRVLAAKLADVFVVDQTDNGTTETKSATVEQIGTAIGTLQTFSDLDTSNKNLVDAINEIAAYTPVYGNTASGAIATFDTSLALPLQDCTIAINAVQESGTPTPISQKAISGFTGANIHVADDETPHVIDNVTAITWQDEAGTVYGGYFRIVNGIVKLVATHGFKTYTGASDENWAQHAVIANCFFIDNSLNNAYLNNEEFNYAITNMFVQKGYNNIASLAYGEFCLGLGTANAQRLACKYTDVATVADWKTWLSSNNLTIKFKLATPVEYTLTGIPPITTLKGTNNIFGDTNGNTSVVYACSLKDYIDSQ